MSSVIRPPPINIFTSTKEEVANWYTAEENWKKSQSVLAPAPAPAPAPTPAPAPSISDQLQLGMNALWQGKELPPPVLPNSGPNFMASTPILDTIPTFNTREELMTNYKVPDNTWTGDLAPKKSILEDIANAFDPKKNGVADAFDPQKNGVADAFDPQKNGVADFFNPPQEEEKDNSSMNLILLGAGALILIYALM